MECWVTSSDRLSVADVKLYFVCTCPWKPLPEQLLSSHGVHAAPHGALLPYACSTSNGHHSPPEASHCWPWGFTRECLNVYGSALAVIANIGKGQEKMGRLFPRAGHWLWTLIAALRRKTWRSRWARSLTWLSNVHLEPRKQVVS